MFLIFLFLSLQFSTQSSVDYRAEDNVYLFDVIEKKYNTPYQASKAFFKHLFFCLRHYVL